MHQTGIPLGAKERRRALENAAAQPIDLLVVGAGITGAGVAREAALRGLNALVVDKGDFASGTSSRSSKLIHGGVRYLAQGDVALVREAARERAVLRRLAPHLALPVRMMIPVSSLAGRMKMTAGLWTFERLAGDEEEPFDGLDRSATLAAEPGLRSDRLGGSVCFTEYRTDDARLTLETIKTAAAAGAGVANHTQVTAMEVRDPGIRVSLRDRLSGETFELRCRAVVNAGGPWFDSVRRLAEGGDSKGMLQLTRGIHLVVPAAKLPAKHAVVLRSPDGRSTFVVPSGDVVYIGTTDTHYTGEAEEPGISADDVAYLMESVRATFTEAPTAADVIGTWSGVRPLLLQEGKKPSEISRRDEIIIGPGPLVSIAGGKLTTFRRMAERVVEKVFELVKPTDAVAFDSATTPLASGGASEQQAARAELEAPDAAGAELTERLWATYGLGAVDLLDAISRNSDAAKPVGGLARFTRAELDYAIDHEMALGLDDVLRRRSRVAMFDAEAALAAASEAAGLIGERLGWSDEKRAKEIAEFSDLIDTELKTVRAVV